MSTPKSGNQPLIRSSLARGVILDASSSLSLGPLPGLEQLSTAVTPLLPLLDGLITSPGQVRRFTSQIHAQTTQWVRADWTNALRTADFVLPPETISHIFLLTPEDAISLEAQAMVIHFLLGYEEQIEADCLRQTVQLALKGRLLGMPLIVDVHPTGPRVVLHSKAVELGFSYALEAGAEGVAVPWPGAVSYENIREMGGGIPIWIKPSRLDIPGEEKHVLVSGEVGLWLDEGFLAHPDPAGFLQQYRTLFPASNQSGKVEAG